MCVYADCVALCSESDWRDECRAGLRSRQCAARGDGTRSGSCGKGRQIAVQRIGQKSAKQNMHVNRKEKKKRRCFGFDFFGFRYNNSEDCHFVIDTLPLQPNVVVASGFSGHGFKFAITVGKIVTDLAQGKQPQFDISTFRLRPNVFKPKL
jgi:hypothetical protein